MTSSYNNFKALKQIKKSDKKGSFYDVMSETINHFLTSRARKKIKQTSDRK